MKRRSMNSSSLPPPLLPTAAKKTPVSRGGLNATYSVGRAEQRKQLGSTDIASGPPWLPETRPRFYEDPLVAIQALVSSLNIEK